MLSAQFPTGSPTDTFAPFHMQPHNPLPVSPTTFTTHPPSQSGFDFLDITPLYNGAETQQQLPHDPLSAFLAHLTHEFTLEPATLGTITRRFTERALNDLQGNPNTMLPTHIHHAPTGRETGTYLAMDLGGSNLRVAIVQLRGASEAVRTWIRLWQVPEHIKRGSGDQFFDWIADRVGEVVVEGVERRGWNRSVDGGGGRQLGMGLTFSFPIDQTGVNRGRIMMMGKGFMVSEELLGQDLKDCFDAAFRRKGLEVSLDVILNDTVATYLSTAYNVPNTRLGLILGTGHNITCSASLALLPQSKLSVASSFSKKASYCLLNAESSMFGGDGSIPFTKWDLELDAANDRPGFQPLEQTVSGRYLGELVRLIVMEAGRQYGLFGGRVPEGLEVPYSLSTQLMAGIENAGDVSELAHVIPPLHPLSTILFSSRDLAFVQAVCKLVSTRGAALTAAATVAFIQVDAQCGFPFTPSPAMSSTPSRFSKTPQIATVAFSGSVLEKYPQFKERTQWFVNCLVRDRDVHRAAAEFEGIRLVGSVDGGIVGAGIAAAVVALRRKLRLPV